MTNPDLLLVGAGHSHLGVLRRWARGERPPGRLTLLAEAPHAWYAGRVPGLLAGRLREDDCRIELAPLCHAAGVELRLGRAVGLDAAQRNLQLADGATLHASWLSLNVGAASPAPEQRTPGMQVLAVKPFDAFLATWRQWQADPQPLAIIGGGAAGVELALALADRVPQLSLFGAGPLLEGSSPGLRLRAFGHLRQHGVHSREHCPVSHIDGDTLYSEAGAVWHGPRLLLASGSQALPWLSASGLECAEDGFIRVGATLQSLSHPQIFASGDCASLAGAARNAWQAARQAARLAGRAPGGAPGRQPGRSAATATAAALPGPAAVIAAARHRRRRRPARLARLVRRWPPVRLVARAARPPVHAAPSVLAQAARGAGDPDTGAQPSSGIPSEPASGASTQRSRPLRLASSSAASARLRTCE